MGPQVRSVRLKYLNPAGTWPSGNPRLYFRRPGGKNEPLPDAPIGSAKFLAAYAKLAGIDASRLPVKGSLSMAVDDFLRSDSFRKMAKGTQAYVRRTALAISREYGDLPAGKVQPKHIRADIHKHPLNAGNKRWLTWRGIFRWAVECGSLDVDPSYSIPKRKPERVSGHEAWTADDLARFREKWPYGTSERMMLETLQWTGARMSDAVRIGDGMIRGDILVFAQAKTGHFSTVPMVAPGYGGDGLAYLRQALGARPGKHLIWNVTAYGKARSEKAASQWFAAACRAAGVTKTAHGLRKYRGAILSETGATLTQRKNWLGHRTEAESDHYAQSASAAKIMLGGG